MKKTYFSAPIRNLTILVFLLSFTACATISPFDQYAYTQTTSLKVDAMNTLDLATDDYATHEKTVQDLQTKLQKIYEYEKNRPRNEITLKMWDKLLDANGHLLGGFIKRWQAEHKLNAVFVSEEKKIIDAAFDQIAGLESHKIKSSDIKNNYRLMGNMDYQAVLVTLKDGVTDLATTNVHSYLNEAKGDGLKLVDSLKTDIQAWGQELAAGKMSANDVEFLVMAKKELIQMNALKQVGLGQVKVDEFKNSILHLIVKTLVGNI